jgi:hypothetical protein
LLFFATTSLLVGGIGYVFYRRSERRHQARMAGLRAETRAHAEAAAREGEPSAPAVNGPIDFAFENKTEDV